MTLYRYFSSKEELLDAAVDLAASEVSVTVEGESWKDELRALMRSVRDGLMRHPSGVRLRLTRPLLSTGALRITERGMEILVRAGFDRQQAAHAYRAVFVYTFGSVSFTSTEVPAQLVRRVTSALVALPPDEYPTLSAAAHEAAATHASDAQFDFGLDRLLDGLEVLLTDPEAAR